MPSILHSDHRSAACYQEPYRPLIYREDWVSRLGIVNRRSESTRARQPDLIDPVFTVKGPGSELIKLFSCSTQFSMKFFLLINVKVPTIVGILTFKSGKNNILGLSEPRISQIS